MSQENKIDRNIDEDKVINIANKFIELFEENIEQFPEFTTPMELMVGALVAMEKSTGMLEFPAVVRIDEIKKSYLQFVTQCQ